MEKRRTKPTMECDRPKLQLLILQYLSNESVEEVKQSNVWDAIEQKNDPTMPHDVIKGPIK
jgi:hypothetical protein